MRIVGGEFTHLLRPNGPVRRKEVNQTDGNIDRTRVLTLLTNRRKIGSRDKEEESKYHPHNFEKVENSQEAPPLVGMPGGELLGAKVKG